MQKHNFSKIDGAIKQLEPHLDEVMRFLPISFAPEGFRLSGSICGFASTVLARYLAEKKLTDPTVMIGEIADPLPMYYPTRMRFHVLIHTEDTTIDPTYTQFLSLVGLTPQLAAKSHSAAKLYPQRRVAVIERGKEREFGERFADIALSSVAHIAQERRKLKDAIAWPAEDACVWMPEDEAFEFLSGIWERNRYARHSAPESTPSLSAVMRLHKLAEAERGIIAQ